MDVILRAIIGTFIVSILGGGGMYILWLKTRPKKVTWFAEIYQLGSGVRKTVKKDKEGNIKTSFKLKDLRPYAQDILEKIERAPGITIHRLQKLHKVTPAVEGDCVDYWGKGKKKVSVLLDKGECTLLKKGYNTELGELIFDPLPQSRINTIKGEMAIRRERLHKEKDILQAITPWVVTGICMMGLICFIYITIEGYIKIAENMEQATENMLAIEEKRYATQKIVEELKTGIIPDKGEVGRQSDEET
jgi:hypothetical protein